MTLTALIVAALGTCVLGSIPYIEVADSAPGYLKAFDNLVEAEVKLLVLLPLNGSSLLNESLEYLLLTTLVEEVSNQLMNNCELPTYDNETYYTALNKSLSRVENETQDVVDELLHQVTRADSNSSEAILLVASLCGSNLKEKLCDEAVDAAVKENPDKYQKPAELLLALGDLGGLYLNNTYEELTLNNTMLDFLLADGLEELRPLINNVTDVKKMFLNSCY